MHNRESLLGILENGQDSYIPSQAVQDQLRGVTFVPIVGPASVGKNTVMECIAEIDAEFARVVGFTTRNRRLGEATDQYLFMTDDYKTLAELADMQANGLFAQYAIHPTTKKVYGSMADEYNKPYMMMDTLYNAVAPMQALPFKDVVVVSLVCEPSILQERFRKRTDHAEKSKRLLEAEQSLAWSLAQGENVVWVDNSQPDPTVAARAVIAAVRGVPLVGDARATGQRLHAYLRNANSQGE